MLRLLRIGCLAALACLGWSGLARAGAGDACREQALSALRGASDGSAIYHQISDRSFFRGWINCDDAQFDLPTAVHESTHFITAETDAFPLIGGGSVKRPHAVSAFYAPARLSRLFKPSGLVSTYLRPGTSSSATDFLYLLDEMNAYSHGLAAAVALRRLSRPDETVDHRDGLAAMMAFVAAYAETAAASEPATWQGLREPPVAETVAALWTQAETVLASSCGIPNFGDIDRPFIARTCTAEARAALRPILGRAPLCAKACLAEPADTPVLASARQDLAPAVRNTVPTRQADIDAEQPVASSHDDGPSSWLGDFVSRLFGQSARTSE